MFLNVLEVCKLHFYAWCGVKLDSMSLHKLSAVTILRCVTTIHQCMNFLIATADCGV